MIDVQHIVKISPVLGRLLMDCQTRCTADCCKEQAFMLTEDSISSWLGPERIDRNREVSEEIGKIKADLHKATGRVLLAARGLESYWRAADFRAFWCKLETIFTRSVATRTRTGATRGEPADPPTVGR